MVIALYKRPPAIPAWDSSFKPFLLFRQNGPQRRNGAWNDPDPLVPRCLLSSHGLLCGGLRPWLRALHLRWDAESLLGKPYEGA